MKSNIRLFSTIKIFLASIFILLCLSSCGRANLSGENLEITKSLDLKYATQFSVDYYEDDYIHIHIEDGSDYVIIPEGKEETNLGFTNATIIQEYPKNIYLAASSAMDLFMQIDELERIKFCSTKESDYTIEEVQAAIHSGSIEYIGKYSAPDYETLIDNNCDIAIESTMIYHAPQIKELLEREGIPVLVERSSYEESPLGRLEWIKLYGILCGREDEANAFFNEQEDLINSITQSIDGYNSGKSVVYFYITSSGSVSIRKPGDYISKMIEMGGGEYAFKDLKLDEENALSSINIGFEDFYLEALDADILIYSSTIDGGILSMEDLLKKNSLFSDFKAVREGSVYCTTLNMFQETSKMGAVVEDFYTIISGSDKELNYLFKVE